MLAESQEQRPRLAYGLSRHGRSFPYPLPYSMLKPPSQVIGKLDISSSASRKCLRELRTICRAEKILPSSYILPPDLLKIELNPFAKGGFGDVYKATYNGSTVCVKRLGVRTSQEKLEADEVSYRRHRH